MSATDVSICSNASLLLGGHPINDLTEANDRTLLASNLFEQVRDSTQRSHPWNCCIKRVALAPDVEVPPFDWAFQFTLPPDYLKTLSVGEAGGEDEFRIESGKLLCDSNPCLLRYVARNTNPATWDPMLVRAMTLAMAAEMAYPITQSTTLRDSFRQQLEMHLKRARAVDGQDDTPETFGDSPLLQSRMAGTGNIWRSN